MDFNSVTKLETCYSFIMAGADTLKTVYYSHLPTAIVALLLGFFVFLKNKNLFTSRILLAISVVFSLWSFLDLFIWINYDSRNIVFSWSILDALGIILFILSLYFVYVFIDKKDIAISKKIILLFLFLPVIFLTPTKFNVSEFNVTTCEAIGAGLVSNYTSLIETVISIWIIVLAIVRYKKAEKSFKKQIILLTVGTLLFLLSFSWSDIFGNITLKWDISQYGLFGMPIFMAFLAYLIVQYKAFNIKLLGTEALVVALVILIGSQFFFIQNNTNRILTGITLLLAVIFGFVLVKSVKLEVKRKEELQGMTEKLAAANDQLRKLDNVKSEFISIASHQLRTPLTAVKGYASLLLEGTYGKISPEILDPLKKIYISNEHLVQLVEELLNVSRIESGRMDYTFKKHQIADTIKELFDTFILVAKNKKMFLNLDLPKEPLPEAEIDASKVREIISNLIDNSFKYTKKGGVTVKAELVESSLSSVIKSSGGVVRITISDTGIGIPKEEFPYLFTKFSRGKDTSRLHVGGTGLGLYVGRSMIEAQHGKIRAESDGADKGARFIIELPVEQPKA